MKEKLIQAFDQQSKFTSDKNHAAACAIFFVIFKGSDKLWNATQDSKWMAKYNRGLMILANADRVQLTVK